MATKLWPAFFGRVAPEQTMSECIDDVFKRALSIPICFRLRTYRCVVLADEKGRKEIILRRGVDSM